MGVRRGLDRDRAARGRRAVLLVGCEGRGRLSRTVVRSRVARKDFCEERLRRRSRGNGGLGSRSRSCWWWEGGRLVSRPCDALPSPCSNPHLAARQRSQLDLLQAPVLLGRGPEMTSSGARRSAWRSLLSSARGGALLALEGLLEARLWYLRDGRGARCSSLGSVGTNRRKWKRTSGVMEQSRAR